jgi:hypothetical protein
VASYKFAKVKVIMECGNNVLYGEVSDSFLRGVLHTQFSKGMALQARQLHILIPEVNVLCMVVDNPVAVWRFKKTLATQRKTPVLDKSSGKFVVPSALQ